MTVEIPKTTKVDENPQAAISYSQLPALIEKIEGRIKAAAELLDPANPAHATVMETFQLMLEVINAYAFWNKGMKEEMLKVTKLNQAQAEMIRNRQSLSI